MSNVAPKVVYRVCFALSVAAGIMDVHAQPQGTVRLEPTDPHHVIPLFTSASASQQGFARIINRSDTSGTVRIHGTDDSGQPFGPITLSLDADATAHFNSQDLEAGNMEKGLSGGLGDGQGNWRLELDTELDIEVSAYIRTIDGFLTSIHDVARTLDDGRHHVPFFNPASNRDQRSQLRLVNLGDESVEVTIEGLDDTGEKSPGGEVRLTLGAGKAQLLSAEDLESGGSGFSGKLGDGSGKWQLFVTADGPIQVMSLLQSPTGHLTNLSLTGSEFREEGGPPPPTAALASFGKFHVIAHDLSEAGDHDAECRSQLGSGFRLADWNDIVSYHEGGGSLTAFIAGLKMAPPGRTPMPPDELGNGYRISRDGRPIWSGRRHYYVARHDHDKPSFFRAHAHIDNHHLSLGSRSGAGGHALCLDGPAAGPQTFTDSLSSGGEGPTMVVIPGGSFRMGCLNDDGDCHSAEFPVRGVNVPRFALSKYEVTFAEWDACVAAGGCGGYRPDDKGRGRGNRPVIDVNWTDAKGYVAWLSSQTGADYRLPSESEWEYAARAGTTTKYHWGNEIGVNQANCFGSLDDIHTRAFCGDTFRSTAPVGLFPANAWGLHDMHGNVEEWVEDCLNRTYADAPSDGSAWTSGNCDGRIARGGHASDTPKVLRSAGRRWVPGLRSRFELRGFRVARTLTP